MVKIVRLRSIASWTRGVPLALRDRCTLIKQSQREPGTIRGDDIADGSAHQAGDPRRRCDEDPLVPHLLHDVVAETCFEAGVRKRRRDLFYPRRASQVALPEGKQMQVVEVNDPSLRIADRGNDAQTTQHMLMAKAFIQCVEMPHAIQHRQDRRLRAHRRRERIHRIRKVLRLAAQQYEIVRRSDLVRGHRRGRGKGEIAIYALHPEPLLCELSSSPRTNQKRDVAPRRQKSTAEVAADGTGSYHQNLQPRFCHRLPSGGLDSDSPAEEPGMNVFGLGGAYSTVTDFARFRG